MKRLRFISYSIMSFTLMVSLLSCSSDNNASSDIYGTPITFSISTTSESQNATNTRSSNEPQEIILDPIKMTSDLDSAVYLNTIISDFPVEEQPTAVTKGSLTTSISSFGVSAYKYSSGTATDATELYIDNNEASVSSSSASTSQTYYWPNNSTDKLAFYAYAPWNNSDVAIQSNRRQILYSVNSTVTSQQDLLTASSVDNNIENAASKTVNLTFNHALTAINFVVGSDMIPGTIKSISFENIITAGTYTIGGSWSNTSTSTFTYTSNKSIAGTNGEAITSGNTTLLMIPQQFTADNQKIKIVFDDGSADHTLYATLNSSKWEAGKQVNYKISSSAVTTLNLGTITFPTTWNSYSFPKTAFANGDAAGLFVVDNNNNVKNANVKLSFDGTKWTSASSLIYSPKYKYFVYYPYKSSLTGAPTAGSSNTSTTAAAFFSSVISNWTISADQNSSSTLISQDLQYAKGTTDSSNSTVSFSMAHGMGLAKIVLGSKSVPEVAVYEGSSLKYTSNSTQIVYATDQFNGNIPYKTAQYNYIALVKPSIVTTFNSITGVLNTWAASINANVTANNVSTYTANSNRTYFYRGYGFAYNGNIQTFTASATGIYKLQVWGASGGTISKYGCGGYSYGNYTINNGGKLYICVGGAGGNYNGNIGGTAGYNGGGKGGNGQSGTWGGDGGGGATHIATTNRGLLSGYSSYKSEILIVAGGGGGGIHDYGYAEYTGGVGGGSEGGNVSVYGRSVIINGGNQTSGYKFGTGQPGADNYGGIWGCEGRGGGGGGYYGGRTYTETGEYSNSAGSGGSGYIGGVTSPKATIKGDSSFPAISINTNETGHVGNGYAIITAQFLF